MYTQWLLTILASLKFNGKCWEQWQQGTYKTSYLSWIFWRYKSIELPHYKLLLISSRIGSRTIGSGEGFWPASLQCLRRRTQIAKFMGPTWGPSGANRTQVGPMVAPWTWGQHGAHQGPTAPRWAPWWPHELCHLGIYSHWEHREQKRPWHLNKCTMIFIEKKNKIEFVIFKSYFFF